jgi:hypothetical protein
MLLHFLLFIITTDNLMKGRSEGATLFRGDQAQRAGLPTIVRLEEGSRFRASVRGQNKLSKDLNARQWHGRLTELTAIPLHQSTIRLRISFL